MRNIFKRTAAAVLAFAVVTTSAVFNIPKRIAAAADITHSHKACADSGHENCTHSENIEYEPFSFDSMSITSDKNYYLDADLDDNTLKNGYMYIKNAVVNLCLNGHSIDTKGIIVRNNGILNICDCQDGGCMKNTVVTGGVVIAESGGTINIYGGKIRAENGMAVFCGDYGVTNIYDGEISTGNGGCVMVGNESALSVYGGTIQSGTEGAGIDVLCNSTVNINGGTITGERQGILANYENSIVNINGGNVIGTNLAAVLLQNGTVGNINGGTVTGTNHSAVYAFEGSIANISGGNVIGGASYPAVWSGNEGTVNISNGNISSSGYKSYIWNNGALNISGGTFSKESDVGYIRNYGSFSLQGSPTLENTKIWLSSDDNITINGALTYTEPYAVYVDSTVPRAVTSGYDTYMSDSNVSKYFSSPYDYVKIAYRSGEAVLTYYYNITYDANGGSCSAQTVTANASDKLDSLATPARENYAFDGWFTEKIGGEQITADTVFTNDTTVYAHWTEVHNWSTDWSKDDTDHWHDCLNGCGEKKDEAEHTWNDGEITKQPTEEETGIMTYTCTVCGAEKSEDIDALGHTHSYSTEWTSDENNHWHSAACGHDVKGDEAAHDFGEPVITPSTCTQPGSEKYVCQTCGYEKTVTLELAEHSFGDWQTDESRHWKVCTVCNAERSGEAAHSWNGGIVTEEPTEDEAGVMTYTCTVCNYAKTEPIAPLGHTHDWSTDWSKDDTEHWHDCLNGCGEKKDEAVHIWNEGSITTPPTESSEGEKTFECTVCGMTKTEPIPATGEPNTPEEPVPPSDPDDGNISVEIQHGENAPETKLENSFDELVEAVLTPEEQELIKDGVDIKIVLTVEDGTETVSDEDKAKAEETLEALADYELGQYLDVNLLKIIGGEQERVIETGKPITVLFEIPEALLGEGRKYTVIRVHGGEAAVLPDLDSSDNTVTIQTDRFSAYALAYSEKTSSPPPAESGSDNGGFIPPAESTSDVGVPELPNESGTESSISVPSESSTPVGGDTPPEHGGSGLDTVLPIDEDSPSDESVTDTSDSSSSESSSVSSGNTADDKNGNPSTGIAVSLVPMTVAVVVLAAAVKRKKK